MFKMPYGGDGDEYGPIATQFRWPLPFHIQIHAAPYFAFFPFIAGIGLITGILGS